MQIKTKENANTKAIGELRGGECFRLVPDGAIYLRLSGVSNQFGLPPDMKVGVHLGTGNCYLYSLLKDVYPVTIEGLEV